MAQIELRNLTKRFGSFVGVSGFDLTIPDREFLVLLGPSGCGKTYVSRALKKALQVDHITDDWNPAQPRVLAKGRHLLITENRPLPEQLERLKPYCCVDIAWARQIIKHKGVSNDA